MQRKSNPKWSGIKVIVVRQPWAWLIVNGHKNIENRSWKTRHRGLLLIQASANLPSARQMEEYRQYAAERGVRLPEKFEGGGIVGIVQLDDCVERSRSKWWFRGEIGWELSKAKKLPFIPMKGRLGIFDPPPSVLRRLSDRRRSQDAERAPKRI